MLAKLATRALRDFVEIAESLGYKVTNTPDGEGGYTIRVVRRAKLLERAVVETTGRAA